MVRDTEYCRPNGCASSIYAAQAKSSSRNHWARVILDANEISHVRFFVAFDETSGTRRDGQDGQRIATAASASTRTARHITVAQPALRFAGTGNDARMMLGGTVAVAAATDGPRPRRDESWL